MKECKSCHQPKSQSCFSSYTDSLGNFRVRKHCDSCLEEKASLKLEKKKRCVKCREIKNLNDFHPCRETCKICHGKNGLKWTKGNLERRNASNKLLSAKSPEKTILIRTKCRAKKKKIEFNLEIEDVIIPKNCPILGIPLFHCDGHGRDNSSSIDRINNKKGYIKGNVHIISNRANTLKSSASIEELEKLLFYLKSLDSK